MASESNMKTQFDTRPLKEEAWLKCKESLNSAQMSGLEAIVEGKGLPNGYRRLNLDQVICFLIAELKWRQEEDLTSALNVTSDSTKDGAENLSPSQEEVFWNTQNNPKDGGNHPSAPAVTKDSTKEDNETEVYGPL